jgi:hypothetical protein
VAARRILSSVAEQRLIDDPEVTLAFYGSILYVATVSALGAQDVPPDPAVAMGTIFAEASVLYIAHVFAAFVPKLARAGRAHVPDLLHALRHDLPLLLSALVPILPLFLGSTDVVSTETGYRMSVRLTLGMLFVLAVAVGRRDGLSWTRSLVAGAVILGATIGVIWLESLLH